MSDKYSTHKSNRKYETKGDMRARSVKRTPADSTTRKGLAALADSVGAKVRV